MAKIHVLLILWAVTCNEQVGEMDPHNFIYQLEEEGGERLMISGAQDLFALNASVLWEKKCISLVFKKMPGKK